ncbi:testis-specific serine/threonine-protein kinase 6-like [Salminus brasiliensis]|uniref:testis-specific serine/threonine-protein kinase 6-like n=1 Tax=Salminus brasiliensis TaxID=930266 RepID=UPI003B82E227
MDPDRVLQSLGYKLVGHLGEGKFGKVKLATSKRHPDQVAIKMMQRSRKMRLFSSTFLPRELAILRRVKHPHIVKVHEIFEMPGGQVYIVMEAVATDLHRKIVSHGAIPIDQAKTWFSQLVSAVVYLHQQNISHRDLKCENVLLTADNQVKLADFGFGRFSRGFPDLTREYCCTRPYAAPEVLLDLPHDPKKSDVWSLGVILYVMVTGSLPFRNQRNLPRCQLRSVQYPSVIAADEPCRAFISYMLRFNPFSRPSVEKVAQHAWLQTRPEPSRSLWLRVRSSILPMRSLMCSSSVNTPQKRNTVSLRTYLTSQPGS